MKILLSNPVVANGAFHHWMTADLLDLGHIVSTIDPDELCEQFGIELYRRILLQRVAVDRPDILFVYPPYDLLRPQDADAIRSLGTAIVGFAYDDPIFLPAYRRCKGGIKTIIDQFEAVYDVYLTTSRKMEREGSGVGSKHIHHIRWACNTPPDPFKTARPRDLPVVVVGAPYPRRVEMVRHLIGKGITPAVFGTEGWKRYPDVAHCYRGMLTRAGMFATYRRAQIAIAPADWESTYTPMVKLRTLEIASSGAMQLCEACEDLADYYQDGKEVVSYRTWDELAEKIRHTLAHPAERETIAKAGFEQTMREHAWRVRWAEVQRLASPAIARLAESKAVPPPIDSQLPRLMGLAACAGHYEKLGDLATAKGVVEEWLALSPGDFTPMLARARMAMAEKRYEQAEHYLHRALEVSKDLCPPAVDATVTQRRLGDRLGLGNIMSGIFPRTIEAYVHLLWVYAALDERVRSENLLEVLAQGNQDVCFATLATVVAEPQIKRLIGPEFIARYTQALLGAKPMVWEGERIRHAAYFGFLCGEALIAMGQHDRGSAVLHAALTNQPKPGLEQQIRRLLGLLPA